MNEPNNKITRCIDGIRRNNMRLQTYIRGAVFAPTDKCSDKCKRNAYRQLRHIIKFAELARYYGRGGKQ